MIGVKIKQDLGLNETQFGILVTTPVRLFAPLTVLLGFMMSPGKAAVYKHIRCTTPTILAPSVA